MLTWQGFYLYACVVYSLVLALVLVLNSVTFINLFQMTGYKTSDYLEWYKNENNSIKNVNFNFTALVLFLLLLVEAVVIVFRLSSVIYWSSLLTLLILVVFANQNYLLVRFKKPLIYTKRVKRLMVQLFCVYFSLSMLFCYLIFSLNAKFISLFFAMFTGTFYFIFVVNYIFIFLEKIISFYYIRKAKNKLRQFPNLIVVAITGSFGKTSCKFILTHLLQQKYSTVCTPKSFNTIMGITKTILNELTQTTQVFVVEMGADRKNDIKKLCKLIAPNIAILTGIGPSHLKTFKTEENIIKTKYQIMQGLAEGGTGVFNLQDENVRLLFKKFVGNKLGVATPDSGYWAKLVKLDESGNYFQLNLNGQVLEIETKLLGRHQMLNTVFAASVAQMLGVEGEKIVHAMRTMPQIKNRLELARLSGDNFILDDSFNSNLKGCMEALYVLSKFSDYKKIVITPGMVDLGKKGYVENFKFAKQMAKVCDEVYVVNKVNKEALTNGLRAGGFNNDKVYYFNSFNEAFMRVKQNLTNKHIILIENDLPDQYW